MLNCLLQHAAVTGKLDLRTKVVHGLLLCQSTFPATAACCSRQLSIIAIIFFNNFRAVFSHL
jgi:hypothetical protein